MKFKSFSCGNMQNNAYLLWAGNNRIDDENKAVLIDAPYSSYEDVTAFCKSENIIVGAVLLTHGHFDHIGDLHLFQKAGAKVYMHTDDADKLHDANKSLLGSSRYNNPVFSDFNFQDDSGTINLFGMQIRYIHTPGHSAGSVCYLAEGYLFSGDTLFAQSFGRTDFYDGDFSKIKTSIDKLFGLDGDYAVCPGHGEFSTLDAERELNPINF